MNKWEELLKREREGEALMNELNRGRREIDRNSKQLDGWANRIMKYILFPFKENLDKYPLGHNVPSNFGKNKIL